MKILLIGNDHRALALGRALGREGHHVQVTPGFKVAAHPALAQVPFAFGPGPDWEQVQDMVQIESAVVSLNPDLVVCLHVESSEVGLVDRLVRLADKRASRFKVFGVDREAARVETSKAFGLEVARTAGLRVPRSELIQAGARDEWLPHRAPWGERTLVLKADGLAGGRGTVIVHSGDEAVEAVRTLPPGAVIAQEWICGEEIALSLLCRGRDIAVLNINFEYKREQDGDLGPNTPGMGTVARTPYTLPDIRPLLKELPTVLESLSYRGPLDVSFMVDLSRGELVFLEFTARFGDPELSSEILLLEKTGELLAANAWNCPPQVRYSSYEWTGGVVVRGGVHHVKPTSPSSGIAHTHEHIWMDGEHFSCFSTAGAELVTTLDALYRDVHSSVSGCARYRTDIGYDVDRRLAAMASLIH